MAPVALEASHQKEVRQESEVPLCAAKAKAATNAEPSRRYRNSPGHSARVETERVVGKEPVKVADKEREGKVDPSAFQSSSSGDSLGSSNMSGETGVEALLAKLRAL